MSVVLVVDDEKSIRYTFEIFLSKEGHEVFSAENVAQAIDFVEKKDFDLIISDIIMPKGTGIELLQKVKEINPDIPMTGEPTVETASTSVKYNAFEYITKPIDKPTLLGCVNRALAYKNLLDSKKELERENKKYRFHLEDLVQERTESLQKTMQSTIEVVSSILELRDPYTAGHQIRVGNLAVRIGQKIGMEKNKLTGLYVSGYLHDLGKISVPSEILTKPSKLTPVEFEIIKSHVDYGYDVLKKLDLPWPVADIVRQHHERMDGSGYPDGLVREEILPEAKVLAVADVVEAMTSHRPYRPGLGLEKACEEIRSNKGEKFDEEVVEAALELFLKDQYVFEDNAEKITYEI
jgi:putative nucleotidyltransferase with HDIG domain